MRSLYVHFPFCETKCPYCDFYSIAWKRVKKDDPDQFEIALQQEAKTHGSLLSPRLDTIFFGGGTPSMTACDSMKRALEPLWEQTKTDHETEWTLEANPSSIRSEALLAYQSFGVNRVSLGVQALQDHHLKVLGRVHSNEQALRAIETILESGIKNLSVDLLCGVPDLTLSELESSLKTLTSYPIQHLSCYLLTLPSHHKLYPRLPKEDEQIRHLYFVKEFMESQGFDHYEISNYARNGNTARHNLLIWKGEGYLGLGPSAHSFDSEKKKRWKNVSSLHRYASMLTKEKVAPTDWEENLTEDQLEMEKWLLRVRLKEGFPSSWLDSELRQKKADHLIHQGYLEYSTPKNNQLRLSLKGFPLSDMVIRELAL